jgi:hypothetical protein
MKLITVLSVGSNLNFNVIVKIRRFSKVTVPGRQLLVGNNIDLKIHAVGPKSSQKLILGNG